MSETRKVTINDIDGYTPVSSRVDSVDDTDRTSYARSIEDRVPGYRSVHRNTAVDTLVTKTDPEGDVDKLETLEELAGIKHQAYADKVNGAAFGKKREENMEAYEAAEAKYEAALKESIKAELEATPDDLNEDEQKIYIEQRVNDILREDADKQYAALIARGGKRAEFLAKYDSLTTGKKIAVTAGLGAVGLGAGFVIGTIGAGAAAVAGGMIGYRYGKSYLLGTSSIYRKPVEDDIKFVYDASGDAIENQAVLYSNSYNREKIIEAEKSKKKAVILGLGGAALGTGLAGAAIHTVADTGGNFWTGYLDLAGNNNTDISAFNTSRGGGSIGYGTEAATSEDFGEKLRQAAEKTRAMAEEAAKAAEVSAAEESKPFGTGLKNLAENVKDFAEKASEATLDTADNAVESVADTAEAAEPEVSHEQLVADYVESHTEGTAVDAGEGWYKTFADFDIDADKHQALLQEVGPKLEEMGVAYRTPDGLWGISESGNLPKSATELIVSTADHNGWVDLGDVTLETEHSSEAVAITKGGGIVSEAADFGIEDLTNEEINQLGEALTEEGTGYESDHLENKFGNRYGILYDADVNDGVKPGVFTEEAQDIFADFADDRELNNSTDVEPVAGQGDLEVDQDAESPSPEVVAEQTDDAVGEISLDGLSSLIENQPLAADRARGILENGKFSQLSSFNVTEVNDLARGLRDEVYSDGKKVVEWVKGEGRYVFNDRPLNATNQAVEDLIGRARNVLNN